MIDKSIFKIISEFKIIGENAMINKFIKMIS